MSPMVRLKISFSQIVNSFGAGPQKRHVLIPPDGAVDPVAMLHRDAAEEVLRRPEAVLVDDRVLRRGEVDEHEGGEDERVAAGNEQEREAGYDSPGETTRLACESARPCSTSQPSGSSAAVSETAFRPMKSSYGTPAAARPRSAPQLLSRAGVSAGRARSRRAGRSGRAAPRRTCSAPPRGTSAPKRTRRPRAGARRRATVAATKKRPLRQLPRQQGQKHQRRERDDPQRESSSATW